MLSAICRPFYFGLNVLIIFTCKTIKVDPNFPLQSHYLPIVSSSPPGQNGWHFTDDIFKRISVNEKFCILIKISLKFVSKGPIDYNPALVQIMAWRRIGDKPLSEPMLIRFADA